MCALDVVMAHPAMKELLKPEGTLRQPETAILNLSAGKGIRYKEMRLGSCLAVSIRLGVLPKGFRVDVKGVSGLM